jgi:hypothetical protein
MIFLKMVIGGFLYAEWGWGGPTALMSATAVVMNFKLRKVYRLCRWIIRRAVVSQSTHEIVMRRIKLLLRSGFLLGIACGSHAVAQETVRYYEQNGATIREARTKVQVPVQEVQYQQVPQTYYQPQVTTQVAQVATPVRRPVTQYQWVPKWHGVWNILKGPHVAYHLEPKKSWATTWQTSAVPVTNTTMVPRTSVAQVAVPKVRYEEREQVTRTVMLPANRSSLVQLPSDRIRENDEAAQLARSPAPFVESQFATHPRYMPFVAATPAASTFAYAPPTSSLNLPNPNSNVAPAQMAAVPPAAFRPPGNYTPAPSVASLPDYSAPRVASQQAPAFDPYGRYGGVARLDGDFPRSSTNNRQGMWQARRQATGTLNR